MISTGSIYTLHEHLCLTKSKRGRRLLPDDQLAEAAHNNLPLPHHLHSSTKHNLFSKNIKKMLKKKTMEKADLSEFNNFIP